MEYWKTVVPFRYKFIRSKLKGKQVQCLDVGCGNNSPIIFKYWFDSAIYHGIDNVPSDELLEKNLPIDRYFQKDLERDQLDDVPDSGYDAVVFRCGLGDGRRLSQQTGIDRSLQSGEVRTG